LTRGARVEEALERLSKGASLAEATSKLDWRDFEVFCSKAFEAHGFEVATSLRFKWSGRLYEVDVAAWRGPLLIAIDCKSWRVRPGKPSQLKRAVDRHLERAEALANALPLLQGRLGSLSSQLLYVAPCLVTLLEESVLVYRGVPIVPVSKLNSFIQELHLYLDSLASFKAQRQRLA